MVFFGLFGERRSKGDQFGHDVADTFVPKQLGIREILTLYGSVLPRCLGHAGFGALLSGLLKAYDADIAEYQETFYHPYTLGIFANVLGFSLVMRLQIAYQRLWEGATQCHQASSKWADAVMQVIAFDEVRPAPIFAVRSRAAEAYMRRRQRGSPVAAESRKGLGWPHRSGLAWATAEQVAFAPPSLPCLRATASRIPLSAARSLAVARACGRRRGTR